MNVLLTLAALSPLGNGVAASLSFTVFPAPGYSRDAYAPLLAALQAAVDQQTRTASPNMNGTFYIGHADNGAAMALAAAGVSSPLQEPRPEDCKAGVLLFGAAPTPAQLAAARAPVLVLQGELDGVTRASAFAVSRHAAGTSTSTSTDKRWFGVIPGASHHSFVAATAKPSALVAAVDLVPEIAAEVVHAQV